MKLTKLEEQGLRLAICLAAKEGQMTLPELAEAENLSEALVAKVLGKLRSAGVVVAARGRNGGYVLRSKREETSVSRIIAALGRPVIEGCFTKGHKKGVGACHRMGDCGLRPIWERLESRVSEVLDEITLADLILPERQVRALLDEMDGPGAATRQTGGEKRPSRSKGSK